MAKAMTATEVRMGNKVRAAAVGRQWSSPCPAHGVGVD
jgi:hypothetical protein